MEQRQLTVHPAILYSIIKAQAGSLSKALLEGVMNCVDAGATKCTIKLDSKSFEVKDNGKGFSSRQEILDFFETFGTPHAEGDATYGRFRMGRGQMFSFGVNKWRTGKFSMEVDIKGKGLDYNLREEKKEVVGCHIDGQLYEEMSAWQLQDCLNELKKFIQYVSIPVSINGTVVSKKPEDQKWDLVTPDAYIKLNNSSTLAVYNLGVLVRDYGSYLLGSGGTIVSRRPLEVNFARNDILQHSCTVWKTVREEVRRISGAKVAKKSSLTDSERQFLASQVTSAPSTLDWSTWSSLASANIVPTAAGRNGTIYNLLRAGEVVFVPKEHMRLGERLHRAKAFFGITEETLARFDCADANALLTTLAEKCPGGRSSLPSIGNFDDYLKSHKSGYQTVDLNSLKPIEQLAFKVLSEAHSRFFRPWLAAMKDDDYVPTMRSLYAGASDSALAWTDGKADIHVEHRFLGKCAKKGINGWFRLIAVMLHEYCHDSADGGGHDHDANFYERFEEMTTADRCIMAECAAWATKQFTRRAVEKGIPLPRTELVRAAALDALELQDDVEPANAGSNALIAAKSSKPRRTAKQKVEGHPVLPGQMSLF